MNHDTSQVEHHMTHLPFGHVRDRAVKDVGVERHEPIDVLGDDGDVVAAGEQSQSPGATFH